MTFECEECQDKGLVPATDLREARRVDLPCGNPDCKALRRRAVALLGEDHDVRPRRDFGRGFG